LGGEEELFRRDESNENALFSSSIGGGMMYRPVGLFGPALNLSIT
jgi:hypothetical protein